MDTSGAPLGAVGYTPGCCVGVHPRVLGGAVGAAGGRGSLPPLLLLPLPPPLLLLLLLGWRYPPQILPTRLLGWRMPVMLAIIPSSCCHPLLRGI